MSWVHFHFAKKQQINRCKSRGANFEVEILIVGNDLLLQNALNKGFFACFAFSFFECNCIKDSVYIDPVLTGAIIDRLAHKAHILDISREHGGRFEETIAWMKNSDRKISAVQSVVFA